MPNKSKLPTQEKQIDVKNGVKKYISQSDIPSVDINKALRVARSICDNYGKQPTKPLMVAKGMGVTPTSSTFRMLCGASIAYGLTDGGYNAELISITPLAKRILAPTTENDDQSGMREAVLKPKIIYEFLNKYKGSKLPAEIIALNVLEEMGVPSEKTKLVYDTLISCAKSVGFLNEIKGQIYIDIDSNINEKSFEHTDDGQNDNPNFTEEIFNQSEQIPDPINQNNDQAKNNNKVFITHGKNKNFIEIIKKLLHFGELEPVVAAEQQSVSQPVPDKVIESMKSCTAAIIHVDDEIIIIDKNDKENVILNPNVLIEIGASMALYRRRFILLVKNGVKLPSNLDGLYEVRYDGENLDGDVTLKLLEAIQDMKKRE